MSKDYVKRLPNTNEVYVILNPVRAVLPDTNVMNKYDCDDT